MDELLKKRTMMRGKVTRLNQCRDYRGQEQINDDDLTYIIHMVELLETDMLEVQKQLDT